jgi:hypothetical protein
MAQFTRYRSRWFMVASLLPGISACAIGPIRERTNQGNYLEAAELCQQAAEGAGANACKEALSRAIDVRLANLHRLREQGRRASDLVTLTEIDQILRLAESAPLPADSWPARVLAEELDRTREALQTDARQMASQPLAAEGYWEKRVPMLQRAPMREWLAAGVEETRRSGQRACYRLLATDRTDTPYWRGLIHLYCERFGAEAGAEPPVHARLDVEFATADFPSEQKDIIRRGLLRAFAQTPWSRSLVAVSVQATVEGKYESVQNDQTVVLHGSYVDHQLAYPLVPRAGHALVVAQTVDFPYEVRDHWRRYEANLRINLTFSDRTKPLEGTFRKGESLHGRDHHVTFEPANIHPVHTSVPTADHWLAMEFDAFATDLRAALESRWNESHCRAPAYSLDDAARCLLAGQTSEPVLATIAKITGDDSKAVARLGARPSTH